MHRREFSTSLLAGAVAMPAVARSQNVYNLKLGHFISPTHIFAEYLQRWADELKKTSSGALNITIFPANTMGPVQNYVDYARTGVADVHAAQFVDGDAGPGVAGAGGLGGCRDRGGDQQQGDHEDRPEAWPGDDRTAAGEHGRTVRCGGGDR